MPGSPSATPPSGCHGDPTGAPKLNEELRGRSLDRDPEESEGYTPPPPEVTGVGVTCLDRKWLLWHDAMKDHAHLEAWLCLADQACSSPAHISYLAAKETLRRLEVSMAALLAPPPDPQERRLCFSACGGRRGLGSPTPTPWRAGTEPSPSCSAAPCGPACWHWRGRVGGAARRPWRRWRPPPRG